MATTVPGGAYLVDGRLVNANGEPIEQPAEAAPAPQPEPVDEAGETPEAEQPAEAAPAKPKRSKK